MFRFAQHDNLVRHSERSEESLDLICMCFRKNNLPIDCVVAVTYRCNSRCTMCDIWKIKDYPEFTPNLLMCLPNSLRDINLSGGEPFLRLDLPDIVNQIKKTCPRARVVISSNGFATDLIEKQMQDILEIMPDIGVAISVDGIGSMHDELRGIPGGFDKAISTVKMLKDLGMKNLRLAFTVLDKNVSHLSRVYDLSRELGVEFTHSFAQSSDFYFGGKQNDYHPNRDLLRKEYENIINKELSGFNLKRLARAYFAAGMYEFITKKNPVLSNAPGRDFFFLDPSGDVYPSVVHNVVMGNIYEIGNCHSEPKAKNPLKDCSGTKCKGCFASLNMTDRFAQFWQSDELNEKRARVDAMKVPVWMICTARTAILRHPFSVGWWVLKNKIFGYRVSF